jgi:purine-binding chemotaxis protein CheW
VPSLIVQAGRALCALDARSVREVLRPLPLHPVAGAPPFVLGMTRLRGRPTPVLDLACLLGEPATARPTRLVSLRLPERTAALAVTGVEGLRTLPESIVERLPPLLAQAAQADRAAVASLDDRLLWILDAGRLLPDSTWDGLEEEPSAGGP